MPNYFLTESDKRLLDEFLREKRNQVIRQVAQPQRDTHPSSQIFIAKPTGAKIDALNASTVVPGVSTCDFYRILDTEDGDPSLEQMDMPARDVYNISEDEIDQQWTVVMKTSHGKYVALWAGVKATYIRFHLVSTMTLADSSDAGAVVEEYWGGAFPGNTVTVHNQPASTNFMWEGVSGSEGIAVHNAKNDEYHIISMESPATHIEFTLTSTLALTDASKTGATVNNFWGGPKSPGATVTVYNKAISTNYMFEGVSGAKGLAVRDTLENKWRISQLECP